ncbi:(deoxy)nucleoside triphosphate pyrophosphohydrolase [Candidatus Pacearchaeota archaeon]|nr:(deoxy)nucleoside triphosphate pyrophosphohydrolase [Candidatus Pacearchaeota archaeon]
MNVPILVTASIMKNNGKYLITQRPENTHNGLRWEFPGGKLNFGEDPRKCLKREIKEELGVDIEVLDIFEYSSHVYENTKHIVLLAFICKYRGGEIKKLHIKDYAWVTKKEMSKYDITQADLPFVRKLG